MSRSQQSLHLIHQQFRYRKAALFILYKLIKLISCSSSLSSLLRFKWQNLERISSPPNKLLFLIHVEQNKLDLIEYRRFEKIECYHFQKRSNASLRHSWSGSNTKWFIEDGIFLGGYRNISYLEFWKKIWNNLLSQFQLVLKEFTRSTDTAFWLTQIKKIICHQN